jgi:hypothetical protein
VRIKSEKEFWSGVMFIVFGAAFAGLAQDYDMGTAQRMGPAFFPTVLGGLLAVLGVVVALQGLAAETLDGKLEKFHLGPIAWVLGAVIAFGMLLRPAGLVVALVALIVISSLGSHEFKARDTVLLAIGLCALVLAVFIYGLGLTIPVLPVFMRD